MKLFDGKVAGANPNIEYKYSWGPGIRKICIIHYIVSGSGYYKFKNKVYKLNAGQSFVVYPNSEVSYWPDSKHPWKYYWVEFFTDDAKSIFEGFCFAHDNHIVEYIAPEKILKYYRLLSEIGNEPGTSMTCLGLANTILGVYRDIFADRFSNNVTFFDKAIGYIEKNFHKKECNILNMSLCLNVSRTTLYREFIKRTEMSPVSYLKKYRIEQAVEILKKDKSIAVSAVAYSCGYQNQYYFSKDFKKTMGVSPSEFRKEYFNKLT